MIKQWLKLRKQKREAKALADAIALVNKNGFSVFRIIDVSGTEYIEDRSGTRWRLKKEPKPKP